MNVLIWGFFKKEIINLNKVKHYKMYYKYIQSKTFSDTFKELKRKSLIIIDEK